MSDRIDRKEEEVMSKARKRRRPGRRRRSSADRETERKARRPGEEVTTDDPYLDIVYEQWPNILKLYTVFADKKPVMLFDVQEQRIYAYPYKEYKAEMNERSQALLEEQYHEAVANDQMVVFVRDNEEEKLVSYTMNVE